MPCGIQKVLDHYFITGRGGAVSCGRIRLTDLVNESRGCLQSSPWLCPGLLNTLVKNPAYGTKHLLTNADSSTNAIGGWTKDTQKPNFFEKRKKSPKTQKLRNVQKYDKISDTPFNQRSLIHREAWFPPCFVGQRIPQTGFFFEKRKKSSKTEKLKNVQKYTKISETPFDKRALIHREVWFPGGPRIPNKPDFFEKQKKII